MEMAAGKIGYFGTKQEFHTTRELSAHLQSSRKAKGYYSLYYFYLRSHQTDETRFTFSPLLCFHLTIIYCLD